MRIPRKIMACLLALWMLGLSACGDTGTFSSNMLESGGQYGNHVLAESTETEPEITKEAVYLVVERMTERSILCLYDYESGHQKEFLYDERTVFCDKYGQNTSITRMEPGRVVSIQCDSDTGVLEMVGLSDAVWEYEDIVRYSLDIENQIVKIADTKYYIESDLYVFSGEERSYPEKIGEHDTLRVVGDGRKVLSITVTTGCGTLQLSNTDLFEGGWMDLSSKAYYKVTKDMQMELSEGTYMLSVANDGYGDSKEITITRGETTVVDLNDWKGEGPQYCTVTFEVSVQEARMTIDGEEIDYSEPQQVKYGIHRLKIEATGYETWERKLYVHSKEANIEVTMNSDGTGGNEAVDNSTEQASTEQTPSEQGDSSGNVTLDDTQSGSAGDTAGSVAGTMAGGTVVSGNVTNDGGTSTGEGNTSEAVNSTEQLTSDNSSSTINDYLKTLSKVLDTLTAGSSNDD